MAPGFYFMINISIENGFFEFFEKMVFFDKIRFFSLKIGFFMKNNEKLSFLLKIGI